MYKYSSLKNHTLKDSLGTYTHLAPFQRTPSGTFFKCRRSYKALQLSFVISHLTFFLWNILFAQPKETCVRVIVPESLCLVECRTWLFLVSIFTLFLLLEPHSLNMEIQHSWWTQCDAAQNTIFFNVETQLLVSDGYAATQYQAVLLGKLRVEGRRR